MERYRKTILFALILIALGIVFNTTMKASSGSLGIVLIGIGGLFLISGMKQKRDIDAHK